MEQWEIKTRRPVANAGCQPPAQCSCGSDDTRRRRPPKFLRQSRGSVGPCDIDVAFRVDNSSRVCRPSAVDTSGLPCSGGFGAMYAAHIQRRFVSSGVLGPVDIYAPCNPVLLATWCGTKDAVMDWPLLRRKWGSGCPPAALSRFVSKITGKGRKAVATRRINAALVARGLPRIAGCVCHVPHCCPTGVVKSALYACLGTAKTDWNQQERSWALSHVRFVASAPHKFREQWNAPRVCKDLRCNDVQNDFCLDAFTGLHRVEKVWDIELRTSVVDDLQSVATCVRDCCSKLGVRSDKAVAFAQERLRANPAYAKARAIKQKSVESYRAYTSDMHRCPGQALVPDDKLKKYMWLLPAKLYCQLVWYFALLAPTWFRCYLSVQEANAWCLWVLDSLLSVRMKAFVRFSRYKFILPYVYGTLKAKCFSDGARSCKKFGHSCIRKVVSCARWPCRTRWRFVHKALEMLAQEFLDGDEVWGLKDAACVVDRRLSVARVAAGHCKCQRCLQSKPKVVAFSADAGQFFETVPPSVAIHAARTLIRRAQAISGKDTVTVTRGKKKRHAFVGGSVFAFDPSSFRFLLVDLLLALTACMLLGLCCVGDACFRLRGLPIGGLLSKVAASLVLGLEEEAWAHNPALRSHFGYATTSSACRFEVACARYVDDVFWASGVYCKKCLLHALDLVYSVKFDLASAGDKVAWLDLVLNVACLKWEMLPKELVFPPPWGAVCGYLRMFLLGRFHRWNEVGLDDLAWFDAVAHVLKRLHEADWPPKTVRAALFQSRHVVSQRRQGYLLRVFRCLWLSR